MPMRYYDTDFRDNLSELLTNYRKMLTHASASNDKNYGVLISGEIKEVDKALKIVKPSIYDSLTEKKIEKLQEELYEKEKTEELKKQLKAEIEKEFNADKAKKLRDELTPQIQAELQQKIDDRHNEMVSLFKKAFEEFKQTLSVPSASENPVTLQKETSATSKQQASTDDPKDYSDMDRDDTQTPKIV